MTLSVVTKSLLLKSLDLCYPEVPLLSLALRIVFFFPWHVYWAGTVCFSGVIFLTTLVAAPWAGVRYFPLEALVSSQFSSPELTLGSWTKPSPGSSCLAHPCCQGCFQLPGPSPALSAFWKCQLRGFPQGQEIKSGSPSAKQPKSLPGFFFWLAFASVSDRLKSQGAEELQQIFTLLSVVVAPGRPSLKCEVCCAGAPFSAWILDTAPTPRAFSSSRQGSFREVNIFRTKSWGHRQTLNKTLTSCLRLQPVVCAVSRLPAPRTGLTGMCFAGKPRLPSPHQTKGKLEKVFVAFLFFFFTLHKYVSCTDH